MNDPPKTWSLEITPGSKTRAWEKALNWNTNAKKENNKLTFIISGTIESLQKSGSNRKNQIRPSK
jgi:hypothetical protein